MLEVKPEYNLWKRQFLDATRRRGNKRPEIKGRAISVATRDTQAWTQWGKSHPQTCPGRGRFRGGTSPVLGLCVCRSTYVEWTCPVFPGQDPLVPGRSSTTSVGPSDFTKDAIERSGSRNQKFRQDFQVENEPHAAGCHHCQGNHTQGNFPALKFPCQGGWGVGGKFPLEGTLGGIFSSNPCRYFPALKFPCTGVGGGVEGNLASVKSQ